MIMIAMLMIAMLVIAMIVIAMIVIAMITVSFACISWRPEVLESQIDDPAQGDRHEGAALAVTGVLGPGACAPS